MKNKKFGKFFRLNKEGVFLLSLLIIPLFYQIIKPNTPFKLIAASFIFFLIIPFLSARFLLDESVYFLGFRKGALVRGASGVILGWIIFFPVLNLLADQAEFQKNYPLFDFMKNSSYNLVLTEIFIMLPVFLGVQTFLFGYAYGGLKKIIGGSKAMLSLSFIGLPLFYWGSSAVEIILASFAGLVACWIMNRSRSVLYPILFGWGLSVMLDALIMYKMLSVL